MKIGSLVRVSDTFLRDVGAGPSDELRYALGEITELDGVGDLAVATVRWNTSRMPRYNGTKYLVVVD